MAVVPFTRFPWWNWGRKQKDKDGSFSLLNSLNSSSSSRRIKKKWGSSEEKKIDKEYDFVLVPSDGVCSSDSESDDSDWSIGWMEPHAPGFLSDDDDDDDIDDSFAVLVPCYRNENHGKFFEEESNFQFLSAVHNIPDGYSTVRCLKLTQ